MKPGEGSAAPKATVALPGTDVNPAGRAPARLAVHCSLATGGPGAAMRHAPFGRPRHPLGTFPCGRNYARPPAGGRNLPQETDSLWKAGNGPTFLFPVSQRISPLRATRGFPIAPGPLRGPSYMRGQTSHETKDSCGRQEKGLPFFSVSQRISPLRRRPGAFDRPLDPFGAHPYMRGQNLPRETNFLRQAGKGSTFLSVSQSFASAGGDQRAFGRPWKPSALCRK